MLKTFKVRNFRGFKDEVVFDLSQAGGYDFHTELVQGPYINKALIYGENGSGKSNLGIALADIVATLTDNYVSPFMMGANFRNLDNIGAEPASFTYVFDFDGQEIIYSYKKTWIKTLLSESLMVDGREVLFCEHGKDHCTLKPNLEYFPDLQGVVFDLTGFGVSALRYIKSIGRLKSGGVIEKVIDFANGFLWFRSLESNDFTGLHQGRSLIQDSIVKKGRVSALQDFLKKNGISYKLESAVENGLNVIYVDFGQGKLHFMEVASAGTQMLELIFFWSMFFDENLRFLFVDEFDAYYHFETAASIFSMLGLQASFQSVLTTHDTYLMQNSVTRPDCVFLITDNKTVKPLCQCTDRELREAHNIEKIYRNGGFSA